MTYSPTRRHVLQLIGAGAVTAGLGAPAVRAADGALDKATITLDWQVTGYHTPFYVGLDQGLFRKHGIDLTVTPGQGSRNTIIAVAANNSTFGFADATALPAGLLQGADVKMVFCYMATTPFGIMFKKTSGIKEPKDLEGKAYGDFAGSAPSALFRAFAKKTGIDFGNVRIVNVSPASQFTSLLAGQVDATATAVNDSFLTLKHKGYDLDAFAYSDQGLNLLSTGVIASTQTLKNADLVKRFNTAFTAAIAAAKADPAMAAAVTKRMVPAAPEIDIQLDMMKDTFAHRLTDARNAGKPPGWMAEADWTEMVDLLVQYGAVKEKVAADRLFTNDYISA